MANSKKSTKADIFDDMGFQEKEWKVELVGRWVFLLTVLAALVGLFGWGPASKATNRENRQPVWVEYERFTRLKAPVILKVHTAEAPLVDGEASFWLDDEYLKNFRIHYIYPDPDSIEVGMRRVTYNFKVGPEGRLDEVLFHLEPETFGWFRGQIGIEGSDGAGFSQLIYP